MPLIKVRRHHQITLPKSIREKLDISEGDYLEMNEQNGQIVLRIAQWLPQEKETARKRASQILKGLHQKMRDEDPAQMEKLIHKAVDAVKNK